MNSSRTVNEGPAKSAIVQIQYAHAIPMMASGKSLSRTDFFTTGGGSLDSGMNSAMRTAQVEKETASQTHVVSSPRIGALASATRSPRT